MEKILIVEGFSVVAMGMVAILEDIGLYEGNIDKANSFDKMLAMIEGKHYRMVFFGLSIGQGKFLRTFLNMVEKFPKTMFVVFSDKMEMDIQKDIYRAGVKGILDRTASSKEIAFAIQRVLDNEIYMDTASSIKLLFAGSENKGSQPFLTNREKRVMRLMLDGKKNNEICDLLDIMPSTVSTYKKRIFGKLNVRTVLELKERTLV